MFATGQREDEDEGGDAKGETKHDTNGIQGASLERRR